MVWCDDEKAQWGEYARPLVLLSDSSAAMLVHQEQRIRILADRKLVLVNPLDDHEDEVLFQYEVATATRHRIQKLFDAFVRDRV